MKLGAVLKEARGAIFHVAPVPSMGLTVQVSMEHIEWNTWWDVLLLLN